MSTENHTHTSPSNLNHNVDRINRIRLAVDQWKKQLIDNTGRNPLLNYRDLTRGTLDLTPGEHTTVSPKALNSLLSGRGVRHTELFEDEESQNAARTRLTAIHRRTLVDSEEKGIDTLFLVVGLVSWTQEANRPPRNAPALLLPMSCTPDGAAFRNFRIELNGEPRLNPILAHVLREDHKIEVTAEISDLTDRTFATFEDAATLLESLEQAWSSVPGVSITHRLILGNFRYATMSIVEDLERSVDLIASNDFLSAVAGVEDALEALRQNVRDPPGLHRPDVDAPEDEFLVLDADSSQHKAINRVLAGESLVMWGPPGTGKSQTIANLIASLVAHGKRILFVAEKRAAIDMVVGRLVNVGLSDLILDAHGGVKSKREFAQNMADSIRTIGSIPEQNQINLHRALSGRRRELVEHDELMHKAREPWNISLYEVQAELISIPVEARTAASMPSEAAGQLDVDSLTDGIQEWVRLGGVNLDKNHPEWSRLSISTQLEARDAYDLARRMDSEYAALRNKIAMVTEQLGLNRLSNLQEWIELLDFLAGIGLMLDDYAPEVYDLPHDELASALEPARSLKGLFARFGSRNFKNARKSVGALKRNERTLSYRDALDVVETANRQLQEWRRLSGHGKPRTPQGLSELKAALDSVQRGLSTLTELYAANDCTAEPYKEVEDTLARMVSQQDVAANLPLVREKERQFKEAGVAEVIDAIKNGVPAEFATDAFKHAWLRTVWEDIVFSDPVVSSLSSAQLDESEGHFCRLDKRHLDTTPQRIKRRAAEAAIDVMNNYSAETALVKREAVKKSRHLSVRRLFQRAPHVLTAIHPCWTMSPLLVSEVIPADTELFDVVIFDEASQIPPAEAIGSLCRAPQIVIAGDSRQLPPTTFFNRQVSEDEDEEDIEDDVISLVQNIESILDVARATPLPEEMLQWHYRSHDERLIAFSNTHIYRGGLTAFPGTNTESPISLHVVPFSPLARNSNTSHPDEVERVVDLVIEHAQTHPNESLGVIAFGQNHANNIEAAIRRRLQDHAALISPQVESFLSEHGGEGFFVKNIERVQGDERDVIILSVGYHKSSENTLPYRFGPLNQEGGERRLNVAVTRARSRIQIVSSFSHLDMDPSRSNAEGVELLRLYLQYAASGGKVLGVTSTDVPLNPFELDILTRLQSKGVPVTPQYGVSGYRIDFACAHPDKPGQMVLAIEADGASYHSSATARDRDRLRQQVLENQGWHFHRVWSTAYFKNRDWEIDRAVESWRKAVSYADSQSNSVESNHSEVHRQTQTFENSVAPKRSERPKFRRRPSISDYSARELDEIASWVQSDGLLRTDDDLLVEIRKEMGFKRGGSRIDPAIRGAIRRTKGT